MIIMFGANYISAAFHAVLEVEVNAAVSGPNLSLFTKPQVFKALFHSSCS